MSLRVIGRRSPQGSMTILGDLAQSTTPAGQQDWNAALRHIRRASRRGGRPDDRLPRAGSDPRRGEPACCRSPTLRSEPSRSVRLEGTPPVVRRAEPGGLLDAVADEVAAVRHRHHNTGVVAPAALHEAIGDARARMVFGSSTACTTSRHDDVPVFTAEAVKGLEFDGVVVVNAHQIFDGSALGARLLYVAMTRAVQVLHLVADAPPPAELKL